VANEKVSEAKFLNFPRNLIDNMDEITNDIKNMNKKYSNGFE